MRGQTGNSPDDARTCPVMPGSCPADMSGMVPPVTAAALTTPPPPPPTTPIYTGDSASGRGADPVGTLGRPARRLSAALAAFLLLTLAAVLAPQAAQAQAPVLTAQAGDKSVTLTWTWSGTRSSHTKWSYGIRKTGSGVAFPRTAIPGSTVSTRSYTITGLDNGSSYDFHVVGTTGGGIGLSGTLSNTVSATPNAPPVLVSDPDKTVRVGSQGTVQVCYNLLSVSYAGTTYLEKRNGETAVAARSELKDTTNGVSITEAPAVIRNLVVGTGSVNFDPCATVGEGVHRVTWEWNGPNGAAPKGKTSTTFTVLVAENTPAKPTGLDTEAANGAVLLHWDDPDDATITGYKVLAGKTSERDSATWTPISGSDADTTTHTVGSLVNDAEYSFKIRAVNTNGDGTATDWVKATPSNTCPPPDGPSAVSVTPGVNQLALTWTRSIRIFRTGWRVQYRETGTTGDWTVKTISDANANSYTITGLEAETGYDLKVTPVFTFPQGSLCPPGGTTTATGTTTAAGTTTATAPVLTGATSPTSARINFTWTHAGSSAGDYISGATRFWQWESSHRLKGTSSWTVNENGGPSVVGDTAQRTANAVLGSAYPDGAVLEVRIRAAGYNSGNSVVRGPWSNTREVTYKNDNLAALTIVGAPVTVTQGSTKTYTLALTKAYAGTLRITSSATGKATVDPATLTFTAGNYNMAQTVTVTGVGAGQTTINHAFRLTSASADAIPDAGTVSVTVEAPAAAPVLTTATSTSRTSGSEINLTWTHAGTSASDFVSGAATFDHWQASHRLKGDTNWTLWTNRSQALGTSRRTVSFFTGDAYPHGAVVEVRVRATGSASNNAAVNGPWSNVREVTYKNDALSALTIVGAPVTVATGVEATYTVALTKAYAGTLRITSSDTTKATVEPATLTFTTQNYNTAQTVTVTGVAAGGAPKINHAFRLTGTSADAIPDAGTVSVTVNEGPDAPVLTVATSTYLPSGSKIDLTWTHAGTSASDLVSGAATFDHWQASHRLKGDTNWTLWTNRSQALGTSRRTVSFFTGDRYPNGAVVEVRVRATGSASNNAAVNGPWSNVREVTYKNDALSALTIVGAPVTVTAGSTKTYTVALTKAYAGTLRIASGATGKATVDPATLTFTAGNYNMAQTVTVTGVEAGQATINHAFRLTGTSADAIPDAGTVSVTVEAPAVAPVLTTATSTSRTSGSEIDLTWTHAGTSASDFVSGAATFWHWQTSHRIKGAAAWTVWRNASQSGGTSRRTVSFFTGDAYPHGAVVQVRVRAVGNDSDNAAVYGPWSNTREVTYQNDNLAALTIVGAPVTVATGVEDTYTVALTKAYAGTLRITSSDTTKATVEPATLIFTTQNYNMAQTVTVTGVATGGSPKINHAFRLTGTSADAIPDAGTVSVTVNEGPDAPVLTEATSTSRTSGSDIDLTWTHAGTSASDFVSGAATFWHWQTSHRIKGAAAWTVWRNASQSGGTSRRTVSFFTGDAYPHGAVVQVRVRAVGNDSDNAAVYGPWSNTRELTYQNDNLAALTIVGAPVTVATGVEDTYTVALTKAYAGTLRITSSDTTKATVEPATLTFTTQNYNTAQTVTVTGVATGGSPKINHAFRLTGTSADAIPDAGTVSVTVNEGPDAPVLTEATSTSRTSGSEIDLTWTHAGTSASDLVSGAATFDHWQASHRLKGDTNWTLWTNRSQALGTSRRTVSFFTGDAYPHGAVVQVRVRATGSASNNDAVNGPWSNVREVTYKNDALSALTIVGAPVTVATGVEATYTVALTKAYAGTLRITSSDTTKATVEPATLIFTTQNYNMAQTVTVTGVAAGGAPKINHAFRLTGASADAIPDAGAVSVTVFTNSLISDADKRVTLSPGESMAAVCYSLQAVSYGGTTYLETRQGQTAVPAHSSLSDATNGVEIIAALTGIVTGRNVNLNPCANLGVGTHTVTWAWNGPDGTGPKVETSTTVTVVEVGTVSRPGAPTGFTATAGAAQVVLSWDDPDDDSITGYKLRYDKTADRGSATFSAITGSDADTTTYTVTSLDNDAEYSFKILATNAGGDGPSSKWAKATPRAATVDPPDAPTGLTATAGNAQVTLTWDDPDDDSITGYEYQRKKGSSAWSAFVPLDGSDGDTTTHKFINLDNDVVYRYRLRAVNAGGSGAHATAKATPVGPQQPTLTATAGNGQVTLSWNPQPGRGITAWVYEYKIGSGSWTSNTVSDGSATSAVVGSLTNGTEYTFRLRARAGSANSA